MSAKVANLIAVELGILIAILSGLAVSNFRNAQPERIAREPVRAIEAYAPVAPISRPRRPVVNYPAEDLVAEPLSDEAPVETAAADDQLSATEPDAGSYVDGGYATEAVPYYPEVAPEPYFDSPDCFVTPAAPYVVYPQYSSSFVVFSSSNTRSVRHRPQMRARPWDARMPVAHRRPAARPPRRNVQPPRERGPGVAPRQNVQTQPARPNPRLRTRDRR